MSLSKAKNKWLKQ